MTSRAPLDRLAEIPGYLLAFKGDATADRARARRLLVHCEAAGFRPTFAALHEERHRRGMAARTFADLVNATADEIAESRKALYDEGKAERTARTPEAPLSPTAARRDRRNRTHTPKDSA